MPTPHIIPFTQAEKDALVRDGWIRAPYLEDIPLNKLFKGLNLKGHTVFGIFSISASYKHDDNIIPNGFQSIQGYRLVYNGITIEPSENGYRYEWSTADPPVELDVHAYRTVSVFWLIKLPSSTGTYKWYKWSPLYLPASTQRTKDLLYPPILDIYLSGGNLSMIDFANGVTSGSVTSFGYSLASSFLKTEDLGVLNTAIFHCLNNADTGDYVGYDTYYMPWVQGSGFGGSSNRAIPNEIYGNNPSTPTPPDSNLDAIFELPDSRNFKVTYNPTTYSDIAILGPGAGVRLPQAGINSDEDVINKLKQGIFFPVRSRTTPTTIYIPSDIYLDNFTPIAFNPIAFNPIQFPPPIIETFPASPITDPGPTTSIPSSPIIYGTGGFTLGGSVIPENHSGVYVLSPDKTNDTVYTGDGSVTDYVAIPTPFIKTAFLP